jgi:hypothetical protein
MIIRGDRKHDIAAWFGLNQGRVAEVEDGKHGTASATDIKELPPSGSPGPKARDIRGAVGKINQLLEAADYDGAKKALAKAIKDFDKNE